MKAALVVLQLRLTAGATERGVQSDIEHALSRLGGVLRWPEGHFFFVDRDSGPSKVKRVRFIDISEGP